MNKLATLHDLADLEVGPNSSFAVIPFAPTLVWIAGAPLPLSTGPKIVDGAPAGRSSWSTYARSRKLPSGTSHQE